MKVILYGSTKGGVGKSTLVACSAVEAVRAGHSVHILDLDPQQSLASWWRRRKGPDNPMLIAGVDTVSAAVRALRAKKAERDFLLVDSPNSFMGVISDAIEAVDAIAIVTQPSPKDLEGIGAIEGLVQKFRRIEQTVYVVNRSESRSGLTRETVDVLKKRSVFAPITIRAYVDYVREDAAGRTANEVRDEAREDIQKLWERVRSISYGERADGQTTLGLV